jgi:hypothetical protein
MLLLLMPFGRFKYVPFAYKIIPNTMAAIVAVSHIDLLGKSMFINANKRINNPIVANAKPTF